jgi:hypothetical protein
VNTRSDPADASPRRALAGRHNFAGFACGTVQRTRSGRIALPACLFAATASGAGHSSTVRSPRLDDGR